MRHAAELELYFAVPKWDRRGKWCFRNGRLLCVSFITHLGDKHEQAVFVSMDHNNQEINAGPVVQNEVCNFLLIKMLKGNLQSPARD